MFFTNKFKNLTKEIIENYDELSKGAEIMGDEAKIAKLKKLESLGFTNFGSLTEFKNQLEENKTEKILVAEMKKSYPNNIFLPTDYLKVLVAAHDGAIKPASQYFGELSTAAVDAIVDFPFEEGKPPAFCVLAPKAEFKNEEYDEPIILVEIPTKGYLFLAKIN